MNDILEETRFILKKYNIRASKSLGQNFLINQSVIDSIIESSNICKTDLVIEIGPGLGTLTKYLTERACKVICIELDSRMIEILNDRFSLYNNIEIINQDILKIDLKSIISKEKENKQIRNVKIVANLPYYITTPIIMKLLEDNLDIDSIIVMIQKEVADRLIETPGGKNTGAITYSVYYYCDSEKVLEVEKDSFIPEPEVTSEVIKLNIRKNPIINVSNKQVLFDIIKKSFMQRRKTLLNALLNAKVIKSKEKGLEILNKLNLDNNIRAEKLTLQDFENIAREINNY